MFSKVLSFCFGPWLYPQMDQCRRIPPFGRGSLSNGLKVEQVEVEVVKSIWGDSCGGALGKWVEGGWVRRFGWWFWFSIGSFGSSLKG